MSKITIKNDCWFLFYPIDVHIGDDIISVKRNKIVTTELTKDDVIVKASQHWYSGCSKVSINSTESARIVVRRRIPEFLNVLFISILVILFIGVLIMFYMLDFTNFISSKITIIFTMIIAIFNLGNSLFYKKSYFKVDII